MPVRLLDRTLAAVPAGIGTLAVAGLVHFGTILAYPSKADDDAFSRVTILAPVGQKTDLPAERHTRLPFRDAAMQAVVCRFDLAGAPFRILVPPFEGGFLSFAFYDREGSPFSGLNLHEGAGVATTFVLRTEAERIAGDATEAGGDDDRSLPIIAPGPRGFVLIEAPPGARSALDAVVCGSSAAADTTAN